MKHGSLSRLAALGVALVAALCFGGVATAAAATTTPTTNDTDVGSVTLPGTVQLLPTPHPVTVPHRGGQTAHTFTVASAVDGKSITAIGYLLVNANSGKVAEVYHSQTSDGANVDQWTPNGTPTQYWVPFVVGHYTIGGVTYDIDELENVNSKKMMEVYHSQTSDGANVDQWTSNFTYTQYWIDTNVAGFDQFINLNSGKLLEVHQSSLADGANVDQWTSNSTLTQSWYWSS